jgi:hypothetical protein
VTCAALQRATEYVNNDVLLNKIAKKMKFNQSKQSPSRTVKSLLFGLIMMISSGLLGLSSASAASNPQEVTLGAYLTSLYDIDNDNGTFSADIWVWTKTKFKYNIHNSLEISLLSSQVPHSSEVLETKRLKNGDYYAQRKISGTFVHDYNLTNFPFDTQKLTVNFEDSDLNKDLLQFITDPASGYDKEISVDGWNILSTTVRTALKEYDTNFGDTTKPSIDQYSRIVMDIELERDDKFIFFKITLGLFAAVFVALFSNFMSSANADIYSNRVGLVGASLLAVVVNQQFADQKIGQSTTVTLVDMLHMIGFCTVFIIFIGSLISRKLSLAKNAKFSPKEFDLITFVIMTILYISSNIYVIYRAINNG